MGLNSLNKCLLSSAAVGCALYFAGVANAQTAPEGQETVTNLGEIIVTAERRSSTVQSAPLAISVRDEATLTAEGRVSSIQRILEDVPGVNYRENTGPAARNDTGSTGVTIRGIGANGALVGNVLSVVPAVAVYVDEVINGIGGNYDVERVEVLRGPQGTLYGRSATSGVVAIHTRKPTLGEFGFDGSAELGNYDLRRVSGGFNVPVGDKVALRVSGQHHEQDGYYSSGSGSFSIDDGRVKLLLEPIDRLSINLGAAFQKRTFGNGGETPQTIATGPDFSVVAPVGEGQDKQEQYWAEINLDLDFATLTYVPTLRYYEKNEAPIGNFSGTFIGAENDISFDRFVTHELRLASNGDSALKWQAGVFHYDNDLRATYAQTILFGPPTALIPGPVLKEGEIQKETKNTGVFAEATYSLTDTTRITAGLRYDHTRVQTEETACSDIPFPNCSTLSGDEGRRSWNNTTFKVRVDHDLTPRNLVYASVSSAFIPGDVVIVTGAGGLDVAPYEAQTLTSYEIGSKNRFLGGRLIVNGAVYHYRYDGFQQGIELGAFGNTALIGVGSSEARVWGAELEASFRPTPADTFDLTMGYVDAYFVNPPALFSQSVSQHDIPRTIPFQATLAYGHRFDLGSAGSLTLKAQGIYQAAYDTAVLTAAQADNPLIVAMQRQDDVLIGNLYATWDSGKGITVSGYVRNVTDELYKNRVDTSGASERLNTEFAAPRTYGVVVSASF